MPLPNAMRPVCRAPRNICGARGNFYGALIDAAYKLQSCTSLYQKRQISRLVNSFLQIGKIIYRFVTKLCRNDYKHML